MAKETKQRLIKDGKSNLKPLLHEINLIQENTQ